MAQSEQEVKRLVQNMESKLRNKYKYILDVQLPFQVSIAEVVKTEGLYYSDPNWANHLIIITYDGIFIPFSVVLSTLPWADLSNQPYSKFLKGLVDIINVIKFNEDIGEVLRLANTIIKTGEIACFRMNSGPHTGKLQFLFCRHGYLWF